MSSRMKLMLNSILLLLLESDFAVGQSPESAFDISEYFIKDVPSILRRQEQNNIKCPLPPMPKNGVYHVFGRENAQVGERVDASTMLIYTCDYGYDLQPTNSSFEGVAVCEDRGGWNQEVECKKNTAVPRMCVLPPKPENGYYLVNGQSKSTSGEVAPFTVLTYFCNERYTLNQPLNTAFCDEGKWTVDMKCTRLCENLVSTSLDLDCTYEGNFTNCDGPMRDGTIVTMKCKQDFVLAPGQSLNPVSCMKDSWSEKLPYCSPDSKKILTSGENCALPPVPSNGLYTIVNGNANSSEIEVSENTQLTYECNEGYIINQRTNSAICKEGKWNQDVQCIKTCESLQSTTLDLRCESKGMIINCAGHIEDGTVVIMKCKQGYVEVAGQSLDSISCLKGRWSRTLPNCVINENEDKSARKSCTLPSQPDYGYYLIGGEKTTMKNEIVDEYTVLLYKCDVGYEVNQAESNSLCISGTWSPAIDCVRTCESIVSYSLDLIYSFKESTLYEEKPKKNGTVVSMRCKQYYHQVAGQPLAQLTCSDGRWSGPTPYCSPNCGIEKSRGNELIIGSGFEDREGSPWHVAIYQKRAEEHQYICGGSIVTNKIVISAAHCFDSGSGQIRDAKEYAVAAGKIFHKWDHEEMNSYLHIQKRSVERLRIPDRYYGHELHMEHDIAIVVVKEMFVFSASVHPVCFELFDESFYKNTLQSKIRGKVVGWGLTEEGNRKSVSDKLKNASLPIADLQTCRASASEEFVVYILANDKFCAGYTDGGPTLCNGDSGGGYLVKIDDKAQKRWFLMGVVSVGPPGDLGDTCRKDSYSLFTSLLPHSSLIDEMIAKYK